MKTEMKQVKQEYVDGDFRASAFITVERIGEQWSVKSCYMEQNLTHAPAEVMIDKIMTAKIVMCQAAKMSALQNCPITISRGIDGHVMFLPIVK